MKNILAGTDQLMRQFIDQLLAEQGFAREPTEVMDELRADLEKRIDQHLDMAVASRIPEDKAGEFSSVLEKGSEKEIKDFISRVIPDLEAVMTETLEDFRNIYLGA